ncbi:WD40 repeat-like protein [Meredithblackwellia eburnea MCA 4105]
MAAATQEQQYKTIIDYLERHGHSRTVAQLRLDLTPENGGSAAGGGRTVGLDEFADKNAPLAPKGAAAGPGQQARRREGAGGQLLLDPPSWEKGYDGMRNFVENSLDIHRPELHPILLPLFVHSYLDLVLVNYRDAANDFLARFSPDHEASDPHIVRMLSSIRLPEHVSESEEATRWRQERYCVRLSERGWGLLLGWLQGGGLAGSIEGTEARGRDRVLAIINERVKVDAIPGPPAKIATDHGLLSDIKNRPRFLPELKLGPAPLDQKVQREVTRATAEKAPLAPTSSSADATEPSSSLDPSTTTDTQGTSGTAATSVPANEDPNALGAELISPTASDLPPYPSTLRTIDVAREVEKVREARKRIKLGGEAYQRSAGTLALAGAHGNPAQGEAAKPSVCLFTIHDAGDSVNTVSFSEDSTLMAAGFAESYIRLWNLKGGKLSGVRNDFDSDEITDSAGLKSIRQIDAPTSRKLIGHSGPVYAVSFDPVPGSSGPPRYLLSASQDTTVRLWSLDTYKNLVAYRGHREPVWDVEWGPRGIYFATASRDRTARLWSSDKTSALRIFAGHLSDVNCVRFHPNSLYLATGSSDRTCRLWDVQKGTCVRVFTGHRGSVSTLAISPDGRYLASASEDQTIILWDLGSGRKVKTMTGHTSAIYSLTFSAESTVLVSAGADATVRVWDVLLPTVSSNAGGAVVGVGAMDPTTGRRLGAFNPGSSVGPDGKRLSTVGLPDGAGGGLDGKSNATLGLLPKSAFVEKDKESADLLATLATKRTPVVEVRFTPRNLCLAAGIGSDGSS